MCLSCFFIFSLFLSFEIVCLKIDAINNIVKQNIGVVNCRVTAAQNNM